MVNFHDTVTIQKYTTRGKNHYDQNICKNSIRRLKISAIFVIIYYINKVIGAIMKVLAVLTIIVKNPDAVEKVNALLHLARDYVLGRMGLPVKERGVNVICITLDAPQEIINSLSGKLGMIEGVSSKVLTTK
jgi:putative iron-only hydrogenase system regulator